jgi:hypothetical protein
MQALSRNYFSHVTEAFSQIVSIPVGSTTKHPSNLVIFVKDKLPGGFNFTPGNSPYSEHVKAFSQAINPSA